MLCSLQYRYLEIVIFEGDRLFWRLLRMRKYLIQLYILSNKEYIIKSMWREYCYCLHKLGNWSIGVRLRATAVVVRYHKFDRSLPQQPATLWFDGFVHAVLAWSIVTVRYSCSCKWHWHQKRWINSRCPPRTEYQPTECSNYCRWGASIHLPSQLRWWPKHGRVDVTASLVATVTASILLRGIAAWDSRLV